MNGDRITVPAWAADYPEIADTLHHSHLNFYCCNCLHKRETRYLTPNFGPFCDECLKEIEPLLKNDDLTFAQVIAANLSRVERWHSLDDWSVLEWAGAMCGEAGEAANFAKKLKRISTNMPNNDKRVVVDLSKAELVERYQKGVGMECADTIIYAVLLCASANADLIASIKEAFNRKSEEYGFPERL